jgi:hypothetical protein
MYYVEILASDKALKTDCEMLPIDVVPTPGEFMTILKPGTYLVGRDIEPGTYSGEAAGEEWCYWERLSCVLGELDCILANDNAEGQFYVEVSPSDFALKVGCEMEKVE